MPKTLLLADDSVTIQKVVGISFANEDVTLITVDNGDDAIARARESRPDAVLADVVMPGKSGYEVCQAIKSDPGLHDTPVLLLTGTFEAFDEERARQVGAAGHIAKPFEAQTLVERVSRLLAERPAAAATAPPARAAEAAPRADDAFDFFDDDLSDLAPTAGAAVPGSGIEPLDFSGDGEPEALSFDDEVGSLDPEPTPLTTPLDADSLGWEAPARDAQTVALLSDDALLEEERTPGDTPFAAELLEPDDRGHEASPAGGHSTQLYALDLDDPSSSGAEARGPVDADDLAQATVLDPGGASGFDVSASDLRDALDPPLAAPGAGLFDTTGDPLRPSPPEVPTDPSAAETAPGDDWGAEAAPAAAPPVAPAPRSPAALDALGPVIREQLHDTLEKIAWDSFGSATEEIVRKAVERVEAVAWEVIPQMAETLIREELRKLKAEDPEE